MRFFIHSFEFVWRHIVAMAMNSFRIIKSLQILKNQLVCLLVIADLKAIKPFTFDNRMKGFNACIIPRKSFLRVTTLHVFSCFLYSFATYWLPRSEWMINGRSMLRRALALFIVSITQDTSSVSESVQAMIFLENRSIILVR